MLLMLMPGQEEQTNSVLGKPRHSATYSSSTHSFSLSPVTCCLSPDLPSATPMLGTIHEPRSALPHGSSWVTCLILLAPYCTMDFSKSRARSKCLVPKRCFKTSPTVEKTLLTENQRWSRAGRKATFIH